jgi:hypothetical protein
VALCKNQLLRKHQANVPSLLIVLKGSPFQNMCRYL